MQRLKMHMSDISTRLLNCIPSFILRKSIEKTKKEIVEAKKEQKRLKDYKYKIQEFVEKKYVINTYFYNSKTYSISTETESVNVTEFEEICYLLGGKLVEIEDKVVMSFVNNIITHSLVHNKVFIGLKFLNGEWQYPSDSSILKLSKTLITLNPMTHKKPVSTYTEEKCLPVNVWILPVN